MSFSFSAANAYRRCPRYFYFKQVKHLETVDAPTYISFGLGIDRLLEVMDNGRLADAIAQIPEYFTDPYTRVDAAFLLRLWDRTFAGQERLAPVEVNGKPGNQFEFRHDFEGNEVTGAVNVTVRGFLDKVTWVGDYIGPFEGKTTGDAIEPNSHYWDKLKLDPQPRLYCWGLAKELGVPVNWVWWQALRRPSKTLNAAFDRGPVENRIPLDDYMDRVEDLFLHPEKLKKTAIARRKLHITDDMQTEAITEHAQVHIEVEQRRTLQGTIQAQGIDPMYAWPKNHLGCDMYSGCEFSPVCQGRTTTNSHIYKVRNRA